MLLARSGSNVRASFGQPIRGAVAHWSRTQLRIQLRRASVKSKRGLGDVLVADTDTAKKLDSLGIWKHSQSSKTPKPEIKPKSTTKTKTKTKKPKADQRRVNIVSERLCDDIIAYYGDTLRDRHQGCDILDLFPGAGIWSKKLNDLLNPRSHILMEPDAEIYKPFLEPLLQKPNTTLVPKSGAEWANLLEVLTPKYLPHQIEQNLSSPDPPQRNDTLLVIANFTWYPKRIFGSFPSVAQLLIYQFIDSIRSSSLAQKYGMVRMLMWIGDDEKHLLLPRAVQSRRRLAIESELSAEWVVEVAGVDDENLRYNRDDNIDLESAQNVIERMRAQGIVTPPGRETANQLKVTATGYEKVVAGQDPPIWEARDAAHLQQLTEEFENGLIVPGSSKRFRLSKMQFRARLRTVSAEKIKQYLDEKEAISNELVAAKDPESLAAAKRKAEDWHARITAEKETMRKPFHPCKDNLHVFRQSPPVLQWDRRPVEPLAVQPAEFFPNHPCALMDIQPRPVHPLIRRRPGGNENANIFDLIMRTLVAYPGTPVSPLLERLHPGAQSDIVGECPSLTDPALGGSPIGGAYGEVTSRCLNQKQLEELIEAWAKSPFAPGFSDMLRYTDDLSSADATEGDVAGNTTGRMSTKNL